MKIGGIKVLKDKRWCGRGDLNPHTRNALPPQGSVSTVPPRPHKKRGSAEAEPM